MKNRRIIILGSKGMLGQMAKAYFTRQDFNVQIFDERFSEINCEAYVKRLNAFEDSVVLNCIGRIKQKSEDSQQLFLSNTIFPLALSRSLKQTHILIHPSTDCVFDGNATEPYPYFTPHTAQDVYGLSKSLGETAVLGRANSLVIRVSIIGPDQNSNKGLLSWFLSNKSGTPLNGFTNHNWNGISTLEWCKILRTILDDEELLNKLLKDGLIQCGTSDTYSKYDMLSIFQEIFKTDFLISPFQASEQINRCLRPSIYSKDLKSQMEDLKEFVSNK